MRRGALNLLSMMLLACGCRTAGTQTLSQTPTAYKGDVSKVLVLWADSVLHENDVPITQGIVARVYLTGPGSDEPVAAPGEFRFYAYNEKSGRDATKVAAVEPDRRWTFSAEQAAASLRKDPLGWGYTFWLPWGPLADDDHQCQLIVRFAPENGHPLVSEFSLVQLPGLENSQVRGATKKMQLPADEVRLSHR